MVLFDFLLSLLSLLTADSDYILQQPHEMDSPMEMDRGGNEDEKKDDSASDVPPAGVKNGIIQTEREVVKLQNGCICCT